MKAKLNINQAIAGSPQDVVEFANSMLDVDSELVKAANPVNVEDAATIVVGNIYLVNVAKMTIRSENRLFGFNGLLVPVLGSKHDDPEISKIGEHLHVDWRFFGPTVYSAFRRVAENIVVRDANYSGPYTDADNLHLGFVIHDGPNASISKPQRKPLVCRRQHEAYLPAGLLSQAPAILEPLYKTAKVCNNVCPHRGISLVGAPENKDGTRTCAGHGLSWDREGNLVPRALQQ